MTPAPAANPSAACSDPLSVPHVLLLCSPLIGGARFLLPLMDALGQAKHSVSATGMNEDSNASLIDFLRKVIGRSTRDHPTVVVPYSGAGPLIPAAIARASRPPIGVVFIDATLPHPGRARIAELRQTLPPDAFARFEHPLRRGGSWPIWTDADLAPLVPDHDRRARLLSLVTPQPASFFEEPLPPDDLQSRLPCAYLRLSSAYDVALATARSRGWPTRSLDLTHFAPYTHPGPVARELLALIDDLGFGTKH